MAAWRMLRMVDLPWQSTNKQSLETAIFRNITGLLEMTVCCEEPPYSTILLATVLGHLDYMHLALYT
jgi:hypothetical protein